MLQRGSRQLCASFGPMQCSESIRYLSVGPLKFRPHLPLTAKVFEDGEIRFRALQAGPKPSGPIRLTASTATRARPRPRSGRRVKEG
jgi:hypothetical protein